VTGRLLTARAVAELLDCSPETILRWIRKDQLEAIRLPGGAIRIREEALDAKLKQWATPGRGAVTHHAGRHPAAIVDAVTHHEDEE
jgi:excisionase family DNA binding protein